MKLEQLNLFFNFYLSPRISFFNFFLKNLTKDLILSFLFNWKIANYSDSYWFLYSNKKSIHELRYLNK